MKKWYQKSMAVLTAAACLFAGGTIGLARDSLPQLQLTAEAANTYIGAAYGLQLEYEELEDGTVEITKFVSSSSTDIELPSVIDGKSVTSIGYRAFNADDIEACSNLTSIIIPDSVTSIGGSAFSGCTSLTSITIPDSVTSIGGSAFYKCTRLTSITIPESVTSIEDWAFYNCTSLASITIPESVTSIGDYAFDECTSLTSITIPDSVISIGDWAFDGCTSLTSITIPESVTSIGDYAFFSCSGLASITIPDSVTSIGGSAFDGCTSLTSITIPDSVTNIGEGAFGWCTSLTEIIVDSNNKLYISKNGILFDKNLEIIVCYPGGKIGSFTIPDSVTSVGDYAFNGCTGLTSVTIPDSVTSIRSSAFWGCTGLTSITIPDSVTSIRFGTFFDCTGLTSVTIPDSVTSIGDSAFYNCTSLTSVTIPNSVTSIGVFAFDGCTSLTSITIPGSVISIRDYAFNGCTGLTSVIIPDSVTSIGWNAFSGCTGLTSITIPDSVTSIENSAFYGCTSLTDVTIPDSVTSIGYDAFRDCTSLTDVTIPDSVTSIEDKAFSDCDNLTDIYYSGTESQWNEISIGDYAIPSNVTIHYESNPVTTTTTTTTITTTTTTTTTTTKPITTTTLTTTTTTPIITTMLTTTTTTTKDYTFTPGADNWSFLNSHSNFGYENYFMLDSYYNKLVDGLNNLEKYHVDNLLGSSWGGSCYGMATTSILAADGILIPSNWQDNATFLNDIDAPPSDEVKSLINYYMALQATDTIQSQTNKFLYLTEKEKLQVLVDCLEDHSPTLLTFFGSYWGHAVVAYDLQYGTYSINGTAYNGKVLIYDNNDNTFDDNYCLYFNSSKGIWTIPEYDDAYQLGFITDYTSFINYHGYIDTSDIPIQSAADSFIATLQSNLLKSNYSLTKINLNQNKNTYTFSTTDPNEIRTFSDFSDNMEANNLKFAMKDASKGYALKLATTEAVDLSMRYENSIFDVTGSNGNIAVFDPSGYVSLEGSDTTYNFNMIYNDGYHTTDWYSFQVDGNHVDAANMKQTENGYVLHADNLNNVTAQAYNDDATAKVTFSTDYTDVLLYEINEETIGVAVDTNGDGTYETTIAKSDDTSEDTIAYGDINTDNVVDLRDTIVLNKYLANIIQFSDVQMANADCYKDGNLDEKDASTLMQFVISLIQDIPVIEE